MMTVAADLRSLSENDRIKLIGESAMRGVRSPSGAPILIGFVVESEAKADRYIAKLQRRFPTIRIVRRGAGLVPGTTLVQVGPPLHRGK